MYIFHTKITDCFPDNVIRNGGFEFVKQITCLFPNDYILTEKDMVCKIRHFGIDSENEIQGAELKCNYRLANDIDTHYNYVNGEKYVLTNREVLGEPVERIELLEWAIRLISKSHFTTILLYMYEDGQISFGFLKSLMELFPENVFVVSTRYPYELLKYLYNRVYCSKLFVVANNEEFLFKTKKMFFIGTHKFVSKFNTFNVEYKELRRDLGAGDIYAYALAKYIDNMGIYSITSYTQLLDVHRVTLHVLEQL